MPGISVQPCCCSSPACNCHCVMGVAVCDDGTTPICPDGSAVDCSSGTCQCPGGGIPVECLCNGHTFTITLPTGLDAFLSFTALGICSECCFVPSCAGSPALDGTTWISNTPSGCLNDSLCAAFQLDYFPLLNCNWCCFTAGSTCSSPGIINNRDVLLILTNTDAYIFVHCATSDSNLSPTVRWYIDFIWKATAGYDHTNCLSLETATWTFQFAHAFCAIDPAPFSPNDACFAGIPNPGVGFTIVVT